MAKLPIVFTEKCNAHYQLDHAMKLVVRKKRYMFSGENSTRGYDRIGRNRKTAMTRQEEMLTNCGCCSRTREWAASRQMKLTTKKTKALGKI